MYTVFSIYYKHAEYSVDIFEDDDSLREYCMEQLDEYNGEDGDGDVDFHGIDDIEILIEKTIKYGKDAVEKQWGWGVVSIIKGNNLINYGDENKRYFSQC